MRIYGTGSADAVTDLEGNVQPGVELVVWRQDGTMVAEVYNFAEEAYTDHVTTDEVGRPRFALDSDDAPLSLLLDFPDNGDPDERWTVLASDAFQALESAATGALNLAEESLVGRSWKAGTPERVRASASNFLSNPVCLVLPDGSAVRTHMQSTLRPGTEGNVGSDSLAIEYRESADAEWTTARTSSLAGYAFKPVAFAYYGDSVRLAAMGIDNPSAGDRAIMFSSEDGGVSWVRSALVDFDSTQILTDLYWTEDALYAVVEDYDGHGPEIWDSTDGGETWSLTVPHDGDDASPYHGGALRQAENGTWVLAAIEELDNGDTAMAVRRASNVEGLVVAEWKRVLTSFGGAPRLQLMPDGSMASPMSMTDRNNVAGLAISRDHGASWIKSIVVNAESLERGCVFVESDGTPFYLTATSVEGAAPTVITQYPLLSGAVNGGGTIVCTSDTRPTPDRLFVGQLVFETDTEALYLWNGTAFRYVQSDSTGWTRALTLDGQDFQDLQAPSGTDSNAWGVIREGNFATISCSVVNSTGLTVGSSSGNIADRKIVQITDPNLWPSANVPFVMTGSQTTTTFGYIRASDGWLIWTTAMPGMVIADGLEWDIYVTYQVKERHQ